MGRFISSAFFLPVVLAAAAFAAPNASIRASRTSGVAPLAVHFDATGTTEAGINAFHQLSYDWDFGDPSAGTWQYSGLAKNDAYGPLSAHVFDQPGSYTVRVTVKSPNGGSASASATITVSDPNVVYTGTKTVCVSASGNFTGCPSGAAQTTTSDFGAALAQAGTGMRVLLRRGDTFNSAGATKLNEGGPGTVGAYPASGPRPIINVASDGLSLSGNPARFQDWRIMDLDLRGPSSSTSDAFSAAGSVDDVLIYRVHAIDFHTGVSFGQQSPSRYNQPLHDAVFIVDCDFEDVKGGTGGYGAYMAGNRLSILGTRINNTEAGESVIRFSYISWGVLSHNFWAYPAPQKAVVKLGALGHGDVYSFPERDSHDIVISHNTFVSRLNPGTVGLQPQNANEDERISQVLVEANYFLSGPNSHNDLNVSATDVTVRGNVFNMSGGGANAINVFQRGIEPPPNNVHVYNNTCWHPSAAVDCVDAPGATQASYNNLVVGLSGSVASKGTTVAGGNVAVVSSPFAASSPTAFTDFRLDKAKAANLVDKGVTVAVAPIDPLGTPLLDGDGDGTAEFDVGAFEAGGNPGSAPPPPPTTPPPTTPPPTGAPAAPVLLP